MTPPTVQFIPAAGGTPVNWDISGTFDANFGQGALDNNPTITKPAGGLAGLVWVGIRQDTSYGLTFTFDNSTNRIAFVSAYPSDFAQVTYRDTLNNVDVVTSSGWSWYFPMGTRAVIQATDFSNWQSVASRPVGENYTIRA
jgi:hypothetical protein